ncbi:hypothetical protein LVJ83_04930 [Uruburuella testudinis]|uniref:Uncharacterized protein n=1 Tax=Uruburuella testudinis TaxID=1282863 RepID=A0ABY4DYZ0_9NEIS|nr:hypothetical protein [Uruburuella testudinis]UOO82812.1 hypothetical protein LVJ83_04930 [Uruburuella testudinis]
MTAEGRPVTWPDGYIFDSATQTIRAKTGGTFKLTGQYNDGLPVLQRLNTKGVPTSNYLILKDGRQIKVKSPYSHENVAQTSRNTHESAINHTNIHFENQNLRVTTNVSI